MIWLLRGSVLSRFKSSNDIFVTETTSWFSPRNWDKWSKYRGTKSEWSDRNKLKTFALISQERKLVILYISSYQIQWKEQNKQSILLTHIQTLTGEHVVGLALFMRFAHNKQIHLFIFISGSKTNKQFNIYTCCVTF